MSEKLSGMTIGILLMQLTGALVQQDHLADSVFYVQNIK